MGLARTAFQWLSWLFVLAVALQFLFAGLFVLGGESMDPHVEMGFTVLHLIPILMFVAALIGRMGRVTIGMTFVLFVLVFIQPIFADEELDPQWIRSLHVLNALFIFMLGYHIAQRAGMPLRSRATAT